MSTEKTESLKKQGKALRAARKAAGYRRIKDLAAKVGCTTGNLSSIERGDWGPSGSLLGNLVREIGDKWLTEEDREKYKSALEGSIVPDTPGTYLDKKRIDLIERVKKLVFIADDDTVDALAKNVEQFGRIPPKKKEE